MNASEGRFPDKLKKFCVREELDLFKNELRIGSFPPFYLKCQYKKGCVEMH